MNKRQNMEQLRRALQLFVATLTDEQAMEVATVYPVWEPDTAYAKDTLLSHGVNGVGDPQLYRVAQAHTSQADWLPEANPALYTPIGLTDAGYPVWAQPTGAQDAYNTGDVVDYDGTLYVSNIDGNTTVPGTDDRWWSVYEG